ncbi:undecaprenyl-diphosphate phosphatase [Saxibacter everestensis]|uniref:Undecaprenyl-diphosphatase n=1 Tax=Saxibacter everestensis TaxID=2909229 RepID=A0ABY8QXC0_9MICO|nr:undecaprenyl-diphosphate phosphatase [Brevibacteriaceae bacterium ZFBP1038]
MEWLIAAVLGVIQGLTEFLPISSSAHIRIIGEFMLPGQDPGAFFTAIIQIGTETAVLVYFWKDIVRIIKAWCLALVGKVDKRDPDARMGWMIIVGSLPIVILGLLFQDAIDSVLRSLWITGAMLIVFGLILAFADATAKNARPLEQLTWKHGILFGFAQALALIPGVSRSGGTITAGLLMGYTREASARYSFLLAIPAVMGSGFYGLYKSLGEQPVLGWGPTALATVIAFVVGYVVIVAFLKFISHNSYRIFVYYRIIVGVIVLVLVGTGALAATSGAPVTP